MLFNCGVVERKKCIPERFAAMPFRVKVFRKKHDFHLLILQIMFT